MTINYEILKTAPRLLMEAELKPVQGDRFQPTGFPDLGPARYTLHDQKTEMLLLESPQSVANRMELASCKEDEKTILDELAGLPYIASKYNNEILTTSYLEAHRLSSPYLLNKEWAKKLSIEMDLRDDFQINNKKVKSVLFKYDPCSLLHGVWFSVKEYKEEFSGGRVRLTRALSGFIEAYNIQVSENGGTKFDKNAARLTDTGNAETGYGTLPFHRTEFTAEKITAYFNLDTALIRGFGLSDCAEKLLIALALLKVSRFLSHGLRLRTACDLELKGNIKVTKPDQFTLPTEQELLEMCTALIRDCGDKGLFAEPRVTEVLWEPGNKKLSVDLPPDTPEPNIPEDLKKSIKFTKGTKKAVPKIQFNAELADAVKGLFPENKAITELIDKALSTSTDDKSTEESDDK